jgi:putative transposase
MFLSIDIFLLMPRKPRMEYGGAIYHIMSRGNRQEEICRDDTDRERFLETLTEVCARTGWIIRSEKKTKGVSPRI